MNTDPSRSETVDDLAYQTRILQSVSHTYALTIPVLPEGLRDVIGNAYLLCRIADTIEDEPQLPLARKQVFWERFIEVVSGPGDAASFADDLSAALSPATPQAEHDLAANTARIVRVTAGFRPRQRTAIERCIRTMSRGMVEFQQDSPAIGLKDLRQLDHYCYFAAGVVGEMLVELFGDYSAAVDRRRQELLALATSHAQGLQMANILKDVWDDREQGACWLPRDVFDAAGFDLDNLSAGSAAPGFAEGLSRLVATTRDHLTDALRFILLIPARETGIRRHLLWALGLALLALRRVHRSPSFARGRNVRVSRLGVGAMILVTSVLARWDSALKLWFRVATRGLPRA